MKKMGNENKKRNMPDKKAVLKFLMNYGVITLGCVIYSFGVALWKRGRIIVWTREL